MEAHGGGGGGSARRVGTAAKQQQSSSTTRLPALVEALTRRWRWPLRGCTTRRALPAVCVAAAVAAAVIVLTAGSSWGSPANEMPGSWFFDYAQGSEPMLKNITADHLLDGLLTTDFSYLSCRSRYEFAVHHKSSPHKPSPYLIAKLRKQEALQQRCGPGTAAHEEAVRRLDSGESFVDDDGGGCRYLVYISYRGLGNRMLGITSAFLYAVLTDRVLLVDGGKDADALFCEPFPATTWLLPRRAGWLSRWFSRSPLARIQGYEGGSTVTLGNMLQSGAVTVSADGNVSWSAAPPYLYLHLAGGYGFHDKLFFCGAQQRLLGGVPWLFMWTDNYLVPGLFLTPPFRGELQAMFPEKDAVFHHLGRYLFHPTNPVWNAITTYYHSSRLAGAGHRVGVQIRVFHKKQPPQAVLDQLVSCVRDAKLLPVPETTNASSSVAVLVTALSSWYHERIRGEYGGRVAVHQPSHEGRQRWRDAAHDMRALSEMYLLSMCDVLVTSGFSTFGYIAQGLVGRRPWVMPRAPIWAADWREGMEPGEPPCRRAVSIEPCFHTPSAYDCAAGRDVELDKVAPYISRCVDVKYGIKLVNESSNQW